MSINIVWSCDRCGTARHRQPFKMYVPNPDVKEPADWGSLHGRGYTLDLCQHCLADLGMTRLMEVES